MQITQQTTALPAFRVLTPEEAIQRLGTTRESVRDTLLPFARGASYHDIHNCALARYMKHLGFDGQAGGNHWRVGHTISDRCIAFADFVADGIIDACHEANYTR